MRYIFFISVLKTLSIFACDRLHQKDSNSFYAQLRGSRLALATTAHESTSRNLRQEDQELQQAAAMLVSLSSDNKQLNRSKAYYMACKTNISEQEKEYILKYVQKTGDNGFTQEQKHKIIKTNALKKQLHFLNNLAENGLDIFSYTSKENGTLLDLIFTNQAGTRGESQKLVNACIQRNIPVTKYKQNRKRLETLKRLCPHTWNRLNIQNTH